MQELPGYELQLELYNNGIVGIYRAIKTATNEKVIIKLLLDEYPKAEDIARIKHEFKILQEIDSPHVITVYGLEQYQYRYALILEDNDAQTLKKYLQSHKLTISEFLEIAIKIVQGINNLHELKIIHKDINPENILITQDRKIKIIDFSISTFLIEKERAIKNTDILEGSLPYMSPEQTGRTNRSVDERTDFYSLGITYYEMLTGHLPFTASDSIEWVHSHIAKQAIPPRQIRNDIPQVLSDLVMKLMAKEIEQRYTTAYGLEYDLLKCQHYWNSDKTIPVFELGQKDLLKQFHIPEKLYGRENDVKKLLTAFERTTQGTSELIIVTGQPGIGKSTLVDEIQRPVVEKRGLFIEGKFDQFQQEIPYSGLIQALRNLLHQILTKNSKLVEEWRIEIMQVLGENASLLTEIIPELESLLGKQPKASTSTANENQIRIGMMFVDFIELFSKQEHPLVIFLDDVQWVDSISLNFLINLLRDPKLQYMTLILAARETAEGKNILEDLSLKINKEGVAITSIHLDPLKIEDVTEMITDIFKTKVEQSRLLADQVFAKTAGNPFFITAFLKHLVQERWVRFDQEIDGWAWNLSAIQTLNVTDNVVELVKNRITQLPENTQIAVKSAACLGSQFELKILASLVGKTEKELANILWPALQEQMITPIGEGYKLAMVEDRYGEQDIIVLYKFNHDRIQQAAYFLLTESEQRHCHLELGRILSKLYEMGEQRYQIFDVLYQYNHGSELITDKNEVGKLVRLNIDAGKKAKDSTTFEIARSYFLNAYNLLGENGWKENYLDMMEATLELGSTTYLNGQFEEGEKIFGLALKQELTLYDRARLLFCCADLFSVKTEYEASNECCLQALELLGIPKINPNPRPLRVIIEGFKAHRKLKTISLDSLLNISDETSPDKILIVKLFKKIMQTAFIYNPRFAAYIVFKSLQRIEVFGDAEWRSSCLNVYAFVQELVLRRFKYASKVSTVALKLVDKTGLLSAMAQGHFTANLLVFAWTKPFKVIHEDMKNVYENAKKSGNLFVLAPTVGVLAFLEMLMGVPLTEVTKNINKNTIVVDKTINEAHKQANKIFRLSLLWLTSKYEQNDVPGLLEEVISLVKKSTKEYVLIRAMPLLVNMAVFGEDKIALKIIDQIRSFAFISINDVILSSIFCYFIIAVVIARSYKSMTLKQKIINRLYLRSILKRTARKSNLNPDSFKAMYECMECAHYLIKNDLDQAINHYEMAVISARENSQIYVEAFINDMMANFFEQRNQYRSMLTYLREARYAFQQWGVLTKVERIKQDYPEIFDKRSALAGEIVRGSIAALSDYGLTQNVSASSMLDLATVMKSAQVISSQIEFEELLKILVKILSENAGAQRGILILVDNFSLIVKVEYDVGNNQIKLIPDEPVDRYQRLSLNIIRYVQRTKEPVILGDAVRAEAFNDDPYIIKNNISSILCLPILTQGNLLGILYLENNLSREAFTQNRFEVLRMLSGQAAISIENARLYAAYDQFVPHEFLELLNKRSIVDIRLGDHVYKNMAVLFSDIRNFTPLSEKIGPVETFQFLNNFLGHMEPIIKKYNGFIDKYIGDAIMALFPRGSEDAVGAAIEMQNELNKFNNERKSNGESEIRIGVGVNTGDLMLGTLGGKNRLQTSVISDVVNVAARLEELTKEYNSYILISDEVQQGLYNSDQFLMRYAFRAQIRGKTKDVVVWEVFAADPVELREKKLSIMQDYYAGIDAYNRRDYSRAEQLFDKCLEILPEDKIIQLYVSFCQKDLRNNLNKK